MNTSLNEKSSIDEIRHRFDNDVERFSNLETGQTATIDAPLAMDLITQGAISATPNIRRVHIELLHKNSCFAAFGAVKVRDIIVEKQKSEKGTRIHETK